MIQQSAGDGGWGKWFIGTVISLLAAGGGIVALLNYCSPHPRPNPRPAPAPTPPPVVRPAAVTRISGRVYNRDTNQPLPSAQLHYLRITKDPNEYIHDVRAQIATTGADGYFAADCSSIEPENFPLRLMITHPSFKPMYQTDEYIRNGQTRTDVNIFIPVKTLSGIR